MNRFRLIALLSLFVIATASIACGEDPEDNQATNQNSDADADTDADADADTDADADADSDGGVYRKNKRPFYPSPAALTTALTAND